MQTRLLFLLTLSLTAVLPNFCVAAPGAQSGTYVLETEIPIGGDGGWDYLTVDAGSRRLYVTHASRVVAVDLETHKVVGTITNTPGVHGFAVAPGLHRGYSSDGQDSKSSIVDLNTLRVVSRVGTGQGPDAILFDSGRQEVYTFNGRGHSATIFKAASGEVVATLPLGGQPEFAVSDPAASRVYCNLEDTSELLMIDAASHRVLKRWPLAPGDSPSGLAIDVEHHRLFVGCHNNRMLMVSSEDGRVITSVPIGQGVDANAFDAVTQLAFSSCGDGTVTIAREVSPDELQVVQTLQTEKGARTMTLDPKTHRIYLASAKFEPVPEPAAGAPRPRRTVVPGSFKVLVYGMRN